MKVKYLLLSILLFTLGTYVSDCNAQVLTSATAIGSSTTTSTSFVNVTGASATVATESGRKILVVATFSGKTSAINDAVASYRLFDGTTSSQVIQRSHGGYFGVGSVVNVFTATASSHTYTLQHSTSGNSIDTEVTITAIELHDEVNPLPADVVKLSAPIGVTSVYTTALASNVITTTGSGGFYVAASIQNAKVSGGQTWLLVNGNYNIRKK